MKGGIEMESVPILTVYKGDDVVDVICLMGQDMLVMGRHNTCDLVVGHASSSRQHVEIQIIHGTHEIVLTDLCSVHGTWLDGKRLPSMTPTVRKDAVSFQLGASRRVYKIDWQPVPVLDQSSSGSGSSSELSTSVASAQKGSWQSGSRSAQSGLRYSTDVFQEFLPSAPYPSSGENFIFPPEVSSSPTTVRPSPVKRSPARSGMELRKSLTSPKVLVPQDENISPGMLHSSSPAKSGQLSRSVSSPTRPMRRLAFSTLQPSAAGAAGTATVKGRSPSRSSPSLKKPSVLGERSSSSGSLKLHRAFSPKLPPTSTNKSRASPSPSPSPSRALHVATDVAVPSKLWLRRCSSAPLPALATTKPQAQASAAPALAALNEDPDSRDENALGPPLLDVTAASSPNSTSIAESEDEHYPSDKENVAPKSASYVRASSWSKESSAGHSHGPGVSRKSSSSVVESIAPREPFRPLHYTTALDARPVFHQFQDFGSNASSDDDYGSKVLGLPMPAGRRISATHNMDLMMRKLKLSESMDARRQWYIVVDTNCLVDTESLKALKQLEGIHETCVVIPKIVVRELGSLKQRNGVKSAARTALKWIESCMVKLPTWIHVQSSSETLPVRATPPVSPTTAGFPHQYGDLMSPTNDDHIVECALIFAMTSRYGRVALLTRDTALKIKAMAEGFVSEYAVEFCESLLSPYSSRFLWAGSTAHGKTWVDRSAESSPASSYPGELKAFAVSKLSHAKHSLEDLRHHVKSQPRGLKLVVT